MFNSLQSAGLLLTNTSSTWSTSCSCSLHTSSSMGTGRCTDLAQHARSFTRHDHQTVKHILAIQTPHLIHQVWLGLLHFVPAAGVHAAALQAHLATQSRAAVPTLQRLLTPHVARQPVTGRPTGQAARPLVAAGPPAGLCTWGARQAAALAAACVLAGHRALGAAGRTGPAAVAAAAAWMAAGQRLTALELAGRVDQGEVCRQVQLLLGGAAAAAVGVQCSSRAALLQLLQPC